MKKLILLLALALGVEVKGQIVGGFMPQNSTKSFTAGNATFSNVIARGTLSVGSTATVSGALYSGSLRVNTSYTNALTNFNLIHGTSTIGLGSQSAGNPALWLGGGADATNYSLAKSGSNLMLNTSGANLYFQTGGGGNRGTWNSTGLRIGSGSNATAVLDVTGDAKVSSTFSLGSANLTGGNTGTVAVRSDVYYTIPFQHPLFSPADATPYYFGNIVDRGPFTNKYFRVNIPYASTLIGYDLQVFTNSTPASAESVTLSMVINNTSTVVLNSALNYSIGNTPLVGSGVFSQSGTGLSTNIAAGDYIFIQMNTPTWATNPTNVSESLILYFKRND